MSVFSQELRGRTESVPGLAQFCSRRECGSQAWHVSRNIQSYTPRWADDGMVADGRGAVICVSVAHLGRTHRPVVESVREVEAISVVIQRTIPENTPQQKPAGEGPSEAAAEGAPWPDWVMFRPDPWLIG